MGWHCCKKWRQEGCNIVIWNQLSCHKIHNYNKSRCQYYRNVFNGRRQTSNKRYDLCESAADGQILSFCYFLLVVTMVLFVHCLDGLHNTALVLMSDLFVLSSFVFHIRNSLSKCLQQVLFFSRSSWCGYLVGLYCLYYMVVI
jgi:hypothetical protein